LENVVRPEWRQWQKLQRITHRNKPRRPAVSRRQKTGNLALGLVVQKSGARLAAEKEDRMKIKTAKWVTNWKMEPRATAPEEGSHLNLGGNEVFALAEPKWKQSHAARKNEQQSKIGGV
jgi:hypothetical protein